MLVLLLSVAIASCSAAARALATMPMALLTAAVMLAVALDEPFLVRDAETRAQKRSAR
ncbi:hypothetical protein GCM10008096_00610 [Zhihengliuella salsuginis]|uniref:Uncharacterized protein n=1 Tax=Zhihengliuella salsuginis TaxID=578222 RepID=A0ABQ3GAI8_9MICC|nr:hypothetical protein GCM10008096_00610 [Zhihengliuella salsuginis]